MDEKIKSLTNEGMKIKALFDAARQLGGSLGKEIYGEQYSEITVQADKALMDIHYELVSIRTNLFKPEMEIINSIAVEEIASIKERGSLANGLDDTLEIREVTIKEITSALLKAYFIGKNRRPLEIILLDTARLDDTLCRQLYGCTQSEFIDRIEQMLKAVKEEYCFNNEKNNKGNLMLISEIAYNSISAIEYREQLVDTPNDESQKIEVKISELTGAICDSYYAGR